MRPPGFLLGRLFGTDIYVTGGFFLLLLLYFALQGAAAGALFSLVVCVSLLVHEFGHVFAVRWFTGGPSTVILWGFGGLTFHEPVADSKRRLWIALMGPAFEGALGLLALGLQLLLPGGAPVLLRLLAWYLVWVNVVWVGVNLLPILPLDGGQALQALLELRLPAPRALAIARRCSLLAAALGVAAALRFDLPFVAVIGVFLLLHNLHGGRPAT